MKILFFGLGSIGTRHARLIKENFNHELYAFRSDKESKKNELGIKEIFNLKEIGTIKPDVAFITNPPTEHIKYATYCAKKGINLFIEKPLSNSIDGLPELIDAVKKNHIRTYTGYCMRHHPAIVWLKKYLEKNKPIHVKVHNSSYLPSWRKNVVDHLKHYSALKAQGGGVILELSHDIDYLYYLLGDISKIDANSKKISEVTVDAEDFVDLLLQFKNGIFGNVHINFLSKLKRIEIIMDFLDHVVITDLVNNSITIIKDDKPETISFNIQRDDYFMAQLIYFFDHLEKGKMMNDLDESLKVFDLLLKIKTRAKLK